MKYGWSNCKHTLKRRNLLIGCHILENKQPGRKQIGEFYCVKDHNIGRDELNWATKKFSSWFRGLAFSHTAELDGFF